DTASGNDMVQYNAYNPATSDGNPLPGGASLALTGSGFGRKATICRTDAFGGTDSPYNNNEIAALRGDPHAQANLTTIFGSPSAEEGGVLRNCQSQTDDNT